MIQARGGAALACAQQARFSTAPLHRVLRLGQHRSAAPRTSRWRLNVISTPKGSSPAISQPAYQDDQLVNRESRQQAAPQQQQQVPNLEYHSVWPEQPQQRWQQHTLTRRAKRIRDATTSSLPGLLSTLVHLVSNVQEKAEQLWEFFLYSYYNTRSPGTDLRLFAFVCSSLLLMLAAAQHYTVDSQDVPFWADLYKVRWCNRAEDPGYWGFER